MKNILYISYDGMTDPLGQSQVIPYLIGLSKYYHIHILSFEKKDRFTQESSHLESLFSKNNITWHPLFYTKNPPILSTIWDVFRMRKAAAALYKNMDCHLVHCRSYVASLAGLVLKKKYNAKFLFDMRGFWADERVEGGIWDASSALYRQIYKYFKQKEIEFIQNADHIISLTQSGKQEIINWNIPKLDSNKITIIPCCTDLSHFDKYKANKESIDQLKNKLNIGQDDYILTYSGSLGTWYLIDEMLLFYKQLSSAIPNSKFLIITNDNKIKIQENARKHEIDTTKLIVRSASRNEMPNLLALSNSSVFFIKPTYSKTASSPTKLAELLAMEIPVICNAIGDISIYSTPLVITVKDFSTPEFKQAVRKLSTLTSEDKRSARVFCNKEFGLSEGIKRYLEVYNKLLNFN